VRLLAAAALVLAAAPAARAAELVAPRPWEAFLGTVTASAPPGAARAALYRGDRRVAEQPVRGPTVVFRVPGAPGLADLRVRWEREGALVRRDESRRVWLLPRSAGSARRERARDAGLAAGLAAACRPFSGWCAAWVHDLASGRTAGWNSDASFPSTVKLGVLVAALDRFGPRPERSSAWPLMRDLAVWSSNDASNRLLVRLGGSEAAGARIAQERLHRLGARSSTFTGFYRLGTSRDAPRPLPILPYRRTTARDVGRMLLELHAAALGDRLALRRTGLSVHEARVGLGLLLQSDARGENLGSFRPELGRAHPLAQKQGWTTQVRHSAAIVYLPAGPRIVVALTYGSPLDERGAEAAGRRIVRAAVAAR
jgi:hypothetical protein